MLLHETSHSLAQLRSQSTTIKGIILVGSRFLWPKIYFIASLQQSVWRRTMTKNKMESSQIILNIRIWLFSYFLKSVYILTHLHCKTRDAKKAMNRTANEPENKIKKHTHRTTFFETNEVVNPHSRLLVIFLIFAPCHSPYKNRHVLFFRFNLISFFCLL